MKRLLISNKQILLEKITGFLFLFIVLVFILYIAGNFQDFIDSTQTLLLEIISVFSIIFFISFNFYVIFTFIVIKHRKWRKGERIKIKIIFFSGAFLFILMVFILSKIVLSWIV